MFKRLCAVIALPIIWLAGVACLAAVLVGNSDVQALLSQLFRPEIPFGLILFGLNAAAQCAILAAVALVALAQLIPHVANAPSRIAHNNRVDRVRDAVSEANTQSPHGSMVGS